MSILIAHTDIVEKFKRELENSPLITWAPITCGVTAITSQYLPQKYIQSRYPKSRKKRIRNKFAKKYGKWVDLVYFLNSDVMDLFKFKLEREIDFNILSSINNEVPFHYWYGNPIKWP